MSQSLRWSRVLWGLAIASPFAFAVLLGIAWFAQRSIVFPRPGPPRFDAARAIPEIQTWDVGIAARVDAWFLAPLSQTSPYPVMVFAHGNDELIDHWVLEFQKPRAWGMGVLLVEYPGYGRSGGVPSQQSITDALVNGYDVLASRPEVETSQIVGFGRSLGGGAIGQLAARRDLAALILESTFTSARSVAKELGLPGWIVRDPFDTVSVLRSYGRPVLLLHGKHDAVIGISHGQQLHEASPGSRFLPLDCGHADCQRPWQEIRDFLREAGVLHAGD